MRKPIFVNSEIQQLFDKQGYVVIPFINDVQRYLLDDCFEETHADLPKSGFFTKEATFNSKSIPCTLPKLPTKENTTLCSKLKFLII